MAASYDFITKFENTFRNKSPVFGDGWSKQEPIKLPPHATVSFDRGKPTKSFVAYNATSEVNPKPVASFSDVILAVLKAQVVAILNREMVDKYPLGFFTSHSALYALAYLWDTDMSDVVICPRNGSLQRHRILFFRINRIILRMQDKIKTEVEREVIKYALMKTFVLAFGTLQYADKTHMSHILQLILSVDATTPFTKFMQQMGDHIIWMFQSNPSVGKWAKGWVNTTFHSGMFVWGSDVMTFMLAGSLLDTLLENMDKPISVPVIPQLRPIFSEAETEPEMVNTPVPETPILKPVESDGPQELVEETLVLTEDTSAILVEDGRILDFPTTRSMDQWQSLLKGQFLFDSPIESSTQTYTIALLVNQLLSVHLLAKDEKLQLEKVLGVVSNEYLDMSNFTQMYPNTFSGRFVLVEMLYTQISNILTHNEILISIHHNLLELVMKSGLALIGKLHASTNTQMGDSYHITKLSVAVARIMVLTLTTPRQVDKNIPQSYWGSKLTGIGQRERNIINRLGMVSDAYFEISEQLKPHKLSSIQSFVTDVADVYFTVGTYHLKYALDHVPQRKKLLGVYTTLYAPIYLFDRLISAGVNVRETYESMDNLAMDIHGASQRWKMVDGVGYVSTRNNLEDAMKRLVGSAPVEEERFNFEVKEDQQTPQDQILQNLDAVDDYLTTHPFYYAPESMQEGTASNFPHDEMMVSFAQTSMIGDILSAQFKDSQWDPVERKVDDVISKSYTNIISIPRTNEYDKKQTSHVSQLLFDYFGALHSIPDISDSIYESMSRLPSSLNE